jgi:hypothetical protein
MKISNMATRTPEDREHANNDKKSRKTAHNVLHPLPRDVMDPERRECVRNEGVVMSSTTSTIRIWSYI